VTAYEYAVLVIMTINIAYDCPYGYCLRVFNGSLRFNVFRKILCHMVLSIFQWHWSVLRPWEESIIAFSNLLKNFRECEIPIFKFYSPMVLLTFVARKVSDKAALSSNKACVIRIEDI
jgi:hypothetical protein